MGIYRTNALVGLLVVLAHLFAGAYTRTRVPDVVFLIAIGLLLGRSWGGCSPPVSGRSGRSSPR